MRECSKCIDWWWENRPIDLKIKRLTKNLNIKKFLLTANNHYMYNHDQSYKSNLCTSYSY